MSMKESIQEKFRTLYGRDGAVFASAGRINLIGEHTDYNGGYVFPGAIDKGIMAEIALNGTDKVRAFSLDYDEFVEFGLKEEDKLTRPGPAISSASAARRPSVAARSPVSTR